MAEKNIYLVGFMASGKTTVGQILARKLNRRFIDTDALIEQETGLTISAVFQNKGEIFFRELEQEVVKKVAQETGAVVAMGGGVVLKLENWSCIQSSGISIYLKWPLQYLLPRLVQTDSRPLIHHTDPIKRIAAIEKLFTERQAFYEKADFTIVCKPHFTPDSLAAKLILRLKESL